MNFAVTAIGRDRPGIVAAITGSLLEAGGNVDDSQVSVLHGHFAMMLIVSLPVGDAADPAITALRETLDRVCGEFDLGGVTVSPVSVLDRGVGASHLLTVYGADRPGIVHDTARLLASLDISITDLRTRRTGSVESPLYTLMAEVAVPAGAEARLADELDRLGRDDRVETRLSEINAGAL